MTPTSKKARAIAEALVTQNGYIAVYRKKKLQKHANIKLKNSDLIKLVYEDDSEEFVDCLKMDQLVLVNTVRKYLPTSLKNKSLELALDIDGLGILVSNNLSFQVATLDYLLKAPRLNKRYKKFNSTLSYHLFYELLHSYNIKLSNFYEPELYTNVKRTENCFTIQLGFTNLKPEHSQKYKELIDLLNDHLNNTIKFIFPETDIRFRKNLDTKNHFCHVQIPIY